MAFTGEIPDQVDVDSFALDFSIDSTILPESPLPVPEPGAIGLIAGGLGLVVAIWRRRVCWGDATP
jgi:hypothetical protein